MFDIGFQELVVIGLIALLVVGPQRLPGMARTAGLWLGRARRILGSVKAEIDREIKAEELKEILRKQAETNPLHTIMEDTRHQVTRPFGGPSGGSTADLAAIPGAGVPPLPKSGGAAPRPGQPASGGSAPMGTVTGYRPNPADPTPPA
jgi:sec-independent protein translocase protein TatB